MIGKQRISAAALLSLLTTLANAQDMEAALDRISDEQFMKLEQIAASEIGEQAVMDRLLWCVASEVSDPVACVTEIDTPTWVPVISSDVITDEFQGGVVTKLPSGHSLFLVCEGDQNAVSYTVNEAFVFSEQVKVTYRFDRKEPIDIQFVVKDADTFALHGDAAVDFIETAASAEKVALRVYAENRVFTSVFPLSSFANDSRPLMGKCKWPNR